MCQLSTYFEDGKMFVSTVSWFLIESNQPKQESYFLPNTEPNSKYHLKNYSENSID